MAGRITQDVVEVLRDGTPKGRVTQDIVEVLRDGTPKGRATQIVIEVLRSTASVISPITLDLVITTYAPGAKINHIVIPDTVNLVLTTFAPTVIVAQIASASSSLSLSQTLSVQAIFNRSVSNDITTIQDAASRFVTHIQVISVLGLTDIAVASNIKFVSSRIELTQSISLVADHNVTAENTLSLTQSTNDIETYNLSVDSSLILSDDADVVATRSVSNDLDLSQTVNVVYLVSSTLTLTQTLSKTLISTPNVSNDLDLDDHVIVLVARDYVILEASDYILVLPSPELSDVEALTGSINVKRSMNGQTYTYVKRGRNKRLRYTFNLTRSKSLELKKFISEHPASLIKMKNWKAEIWKVYIVNNPIEMIAQERWSPCREKIEVVLEFEGNKITT